MKKLIAGNWKMNSDKESALNLIGGIGAALFVEPKLRQTCDILICPPSLYLSQVKNLCLEHNLLLGAQDCSPHESGAHTGDIAANMVKDCGGQYVILGHSERRQNHGETDALIAEKVTAAHAADLVTIICVGETEAQRSDGKQEDVIGEQLKNALPDSVNADNTVIAYEPVWAIGTGKTASVDDVKTMHSFIRAYLEGNTEGGNKTRILYGGSMKPNNAAELLATPNVDGGLIGGASLKAEDFIAIAQTAT